MRVRQRTGDCDAADDYWEQSLRPLNCLVFIVPLLLLYEVGVVWLGPSAMRNGADIWLREFLSWIGLGEYFFLPLVTCGLLFAWHHVSRRAWHLRGDVLSGMVCESFGFGVAMLAVAQLFSSLFPEMTQAGSLEFQAAMRVAEPLHRIAQMLSYLGAGIYEELLFRLVLLSGTILMCRRMGIPYLTAIVFAVLSTSLLFAAAHYELFFEVGLEFSWYSFAFRMLAGILFSLLFLQRGFGIAVGAHAVYDILVATITG